MSQEWEICHFNTSHLLGPVFRNKHDRQRLRARAEHFQPLLTLWSVVAMQWPAFCVSLCFLWGSVIPSMLLSPPVTGAEGKERTSSSNSIMWYAGAAGRLMLVTLSDD